MDYGVRMAYTQLEKFPSSLKDAKNMIYGVRMGHMQFKKFT